MNRAAGDDAVANSVDGTVTGPVVQAGTVHAVYLHAQRNPVTPAQLPAAPTVLACRERELAELAAFRAESTQLPLAILSGPGGIGKTALALHWLHRIRADYPDGQLYADLGAFDPAGPATPDTVLEWFLVALGLPADEVPDTPPQREAAFRSLTADRAIAVLLDNAVSAAQVRPLLPATGAGVAVVTSRWRLAGLAERGRYVELAHLAPAQSMDLLAQLVGTERVSAEPDAARKMVAACAGLPIALTMIAARLRTRPHRSLEREAGSLARRSSLLRMSSGDSSLDMVFDSSVDSLSAEAAGLYRLCGLHPGGGFGAEVLADVSGVSLEGVEDGLEELLDTNLLLEDVSGRLRFHDLIRDHAVVCARREIPELERATLGRALVEWYLAMTARADAVAHPHRWRISAYYSDDSLPHREFDSRNGAMRWLEEEQSAVRSALLEAHRQGWHELVWQFCEALWGFFLHHRHYQDWIEIQRMGIEAAQHCGHRLAQARLRSQLGFALAKLGRYEAAISENELALRLAKAEKHDPSVATALSQLGRAARGLGDLPGALRYFRQAADIQARVGIPRGVALCRRRAGDVLAELGRLDEALVELRAAATAMVELGDKAQYARTLLIIGPLQARRGHAEEGLALLGEALAVIRRLRSPHYTAEVLFALGELEAAGGHLESARTHLTEARDLYESMDDDRVGAVVSRLAEVTSSEA
jgi:tetratricopeptide (TPR) repeat protein